jgi:AmmeMemoRadiSam system protein B
MKIRKSQLSGGWYPDSGQRIEDFLQAVTDYLNAGPAPIGPVTSAIAPHAGWFFSGKLAARVMARAARSLSAAPPGLVVVLGGHLGPEAPLIVYEEDAWETPLGLLSMDPSLNGLLADLSPRVWRGDSDDNTIEVLLPLVKNYFPEAKLFPIRVPPSSLATELGDVLRGLILRPDFPGPALVIASTDLTHYGAAYGFAPAGAGPEGEKFRRLNDAAFVEAALSLNQKAILTKGLNDKGACSAGAAMVAARLAELAGAIGLLVDSYASGDVQPKSESGGHSVGYAGLEYALMA